MPQYTPDTIEEVHLALRGLSHRIRVEIEPGVPLAANTVAGLRARATWLPGLQLMVPDDPDHPKSVLKVECELICSSGEKLVSVTCPGGTIHIEEIADSNSASCVGASGPALALCVRQ